jgi:hypothetical protein
MADTIALPFDVIAGYMTNLTRSVVHHDASPHGDVFVRSNGAVLILDRTGRWLRAVCE